jgi:predicted O-methyltransferase YrrM
MNLQQLYHNLVTEYGSGTTGEMVTLFSDKGTVHSYIDVYEKYFVTKKSNVSLLEIGMMTGGSMHLWQKYFEKYKLVGIDLSPGWNVERPFQSDLHSDADVTLIFGVDSRSANVPDVVSGQEFDFVIDDGDHSVLAQMDTFQNYWPRLKTGGVYFIEDVVGEVQAEALKKFLSRYSNCKVDHYTGLKNNRADDQIIIVRKLHD